MTLGKRQIEALQIRALSGELTPEDSRRLMRSSIYSRIENLQRRKQRNEQKSLTLKQSDKDD